MLDNGLNMHYSKLHNLDVRSFVMYFCDSKRLAIFNEDGFLIQQCCNEESFLDWCVEFNCCELLPIC